MGNEVYLDYAATTPVDPAVVELMVRYLGPNGAYGNPASMTHGLGREAAEAVEQARAQVASLINARPEEVIWTSGATESINLAIKGIALANSGRGRHIITSCIEHSATLDTCRHLECDGFEVTMIRPDQHGIISSASVSKALRDDTILVSLMHVNNEVGTITDVGAIAKLTREHGVAFHIDAVQGAGRLPIDMRIIEADFISLSGHKIYGPKGIGILYVRANSDISIVPQMHGGYQNLGLRPGTLATHQIAGMGEAAKLMREHLEVDRQAISELENQIFDHLFEIEHFSINGNLQQRVPGIINIGFACVNNKSLILALRDQLAFSVGSACTSYRVEPSHVLLGLGLSPDWANCSIRISLGRFTTKCEIDFAASRLREAIHNLRSLSSKWPNFDAKVPAFTATKPSLVA